MDMKKILQAMDGVAAKPVEGSNDMKKFLSVITEGANPHKVTLPVQMAMNHYQAPKEPTVKKESLFKKYFAEAEEQVTAELEAERAIKEQRIKQYARKIADRVLEGKESAREKWTKSSAEREKKHTEREAEQAKLPKEKRSGAAIDALEKHLKTNEGRQELTPYEAGEADGLSNEPYENPYLEGSKSYAEFRKGYRAGYAERELDEGFQDFNKVEPYYVCIGGKPWKKFDYYEDARRAHDNLKKKWYKEGNPKYDTVTLMPADLDESIENQPDAVTVDIPLLIRLLEYAREDAKTDMDLHNVAEKLIAFSEHGDTLTMANYDAIVGEQESLPPPTN